ncbi:hypothetical protein FRC04_004211 [Tulasnella sp. 424]|nr:hypothetical protein FRC04_004211 [Tulasnella sp. 424]KAG8964043.1 hypothetical protein FRC05_004327 [Tulasnella sp. 425]
MTAEPPRPASLAPEPVAQALTLLVKAVEESEPASDADGQDIESQMTHLDRLAWRRHVAAEALQLAAQAEAALFRRRRNALLPIHRLPSELLSAILIEAVDKDLVLHKMEVLQLLAQVAWKWWQTIKSDPQFWAHITPPMGGVELQIRKARILPLRLSWPTSVGVQSRDAFKDLLQRHAERWTSMDLESPEDVVLQVLCTHPFPRLEYLELHPNYMTMGGAWRLNLANFQNLQEAHLPILPYFSISPTSNSSLFLQTLHLNLDFDGSYSSYDLESVLRYSPQLIELEVEDLNDDTSPPSPVNTPIINLPMLRHLRFSNVVTGEERDKIPLIAQIRAPLLEKFGLRYRNIGRDRAIDIGGRTIFDALVTRPRASLNRSEDAPLYSTLRNAGPSASWKVGVGNRRVSITAKDGLEERLDLHCSRKDDIPRYILQPLAMFTLPVDLDLGWWDEDTKLAFWDAVLDATPLLRSFTLDCSLQVAEQVMDRLSTKAPSPSSINPRAPLLEKVCFQADPELSDEDLWAEGDAGEAVKAMLESRRNLFIQGGVLDPPKLVVIEPSGSVFDEVEGRWV